MTEIVLVTVQYIRNPISTLCCGQAASMASLLLSAGEKGHRQSLPNSRIMMHQPSGGYQVCPLNPSNTHLWGALRQEGLR